MITEQRTEPAVRFHPRRLGHANLFVSDLDRSMRFYSAVCGLEEVRREPAIRIGFLSNGNTHHDVGLVVEVEDRLAEAVVHAQAGVADVSHGACAPVGAAGG